MLLASRLESRLSALLKWGLFLLLPLPLYVSSSMLFPFITGRNFGFRIIVELLVILWVGLLVLSKEYRPRPSLLTGSVICFLFVITLADILGANSYRSFWSNYERMEGLLAIIHMALFFLLASSVFRKLSDWKMYLYGSTIISVIVSFIALSQKLGITKSLQGGARVDGAIGNPAYLASYLMFHVFFLLFFIWRERIVWLRWLAGGVITFELIIIYFTATRGVILGFLGALILIALAFLFRTPGDRLEARLRLFAGISLGVVLLIVGAFIVLRNVPAFRSDPVLGRFATLSFQERTVQSRFLIWNIALQGVKERPILGWGQENFYLLFNKYYDPQLWSSEPWFDRSHNVFLDWLVHTGVLGLLAYLAVLGFGMLNIWRAWRKGTLAYYEMAVLGGLLLAYFFQNLFVFDNFQSYFLLFLTLAFTEYLASSSVEAAREPERVRGPAVNHLVNPNMAFWGMGVVAVPIVIWLYYGSYLPVQASKSLIKSLSIARVESKAPIGAIQESFKKTMDYETFGNGEAREQLVGLMRSIVADPSRGTPEELKNFAVYVIDEAQKLTVGAAPDAKHLLFLGSAYNTAASLDPSYGRKALEALRLAVALAPRKQPMYFELATTELGLGNTKAALQAMEEAVRLDPSFPTAHLNTGLVAAYAGNADLVASELAEFRKLVAVPDETSFERMIAAYSQIGDFQDIKSLIEEAIQREPVNALLYGRYAAILATVGDIKGAREAAIKAGELDPKLQPQVEQFLKELDDRAKGIIPNLAP